MPLFMQYDNVDLVMVRTITACSVLCITFTVLLGCKPKPLGVKPVQRVRPVSTSAYRDTDNTVLAMIGKNKVTLGDIKRLRRDMPVVQKLMFAGKRGLRHMVEAYVEMLMFAMEAKRVGLDRSPMTMEGIRQFEALHYLDRAILKKTGKLRFTDQQLWTFYKSHPQYFHLPERHECLDIHASTEPQIQKIYNRLSIALNEISDKSPEDIFKDFVKRYSQDPDKQKTGGSLGFLPGVGDSKPQVPPEVVAEAARMHVIFGISKPFKASDGYHILFLSRIKPPVDMDFRSAKPRIENILRQQMETRAGQAIAHSLLSNARIKINQKVLNEIK